MPISFLKKNKKEIKKPKGEKKSVKKEATSQKISSVKKSYFDTVGKILISPHISEKGTLIGKQDQYIFRVTPKANKTEIKKAVKSLYGVDVLSVNIIKIPRKKRRLGRVSGFKKGYKKAIIKVKKNQKIDIFPK